MSIILCFYSVVISSPADFSFFFEFLPLFRLYWWILDGKPMSLIEVNICCSLSLAASCYCSSAVLGSIKEDCLFLQICDFC